MSRAQIFSLDLIIAVTVFIFVLVASYWVEVSTVSGIDAREDVQFFESSARQASNFLVLSYLATKPNILDTGKTEEFFAGNYTEAKEILGIRDPLELRVRLLDRNRKVLKDFGKTGNATHGTVIDRICSYNGQVALLRVEVWHE